MRYFYGPARQRGRGLGALAQVVGRVAIPFAQKYLVPAAKQIGKDFVQSAIPELGEVFKGKKKLKKALKSAGTKTLKKQVGSGKVIRKKTLTKNSRKQRSRSDFFKNLKE